eukprot:9048519-Pyramimonas_sp.AAC.2
MMLTSAMVGADGGNSRSPAHSSLCLLSAYRENTRLAVVHCDVQCKRKISMCGVRRAVASRPH